MVYVVFQNYSISVGKIERESKERRWEKVNNNGYHMANLSFNQGLCFTTTFWIIRDVKRVVVRRYSWIVATLND